MTLMMRKGRYRVRRAEGDADVIAAQRLRHLCFLSGPGHPRGQMAGRDRDIFDARCQHVLIEDPQGQLVACFRLALLADGGAVAQSYAAQYYDLAGLAGYAAPIVELGRFCVHPDKADADILRVAWGAIAGFVDQAGAGLLVGCSSFAGVDPAAYADAFALLHSRHTAPAQWAPGIRAPEVIRFQTTGCDQRLAMMQMPPLLRSYLGMGGWVSDHAVVDRAMNTLHVFTGVEIAAIPAVRARALRALAA